MRKRFLSLFLTLILLAGVVATLAMPASAASTYYWPVPGHTSLSRGYISGHPAIDVHDSSINGATVIAAVGGTVYRRYTCGTQHYGDMHDCSGFGTGLVILGDDGWYYQYAHMQANSLTVSLNQYVAAGTAIGKVGTTGNSTGPHLHFAIATTSTWWEPNVNPQNLAYNYATPGANYLNLGDNFYAYIKFPATGHGVCNVNNNVQLGTYGSQSSLWNFVRQSNGSYKIVSAVNGTVMDVANGATANETNLWTYANNDTIAQRFYIQAAGSNYNIIAANCGKSVDVRDGVNSTTGTNVHIFTSNTTADQKFEINIVNWVQLDGSWYFHVNGAFKTGWLSFGNQWYYLNSDGVMQTGWQDIGGKWYYFNGDGIMQTGTVTIGSKQHKFSSDGVWQGEVVTSGWAQKGSAWYYYTSSGAKATGWNQIGSKWYYFNSSGVMQVGWVKVGNAWYYLSSSGAMQTGWQKIGSSWYYFNNSGVMQTGSVTINGKKNNFSASGVWLGEAVTVTGWVQQGGYWYYYHSNGTLATGWLQLGGKWYGFNEHGQMLTGLATYNNNYYYFNASGVMQTGWVKIDGYWHYFQSSGAMQFGWLQLGNKWYAFNGDGQMITGWGQDGDNYYYFNSDGTMVTGRKYIDGYWYTFNSNGVLVG